jgi:tetratricopeptide repeat protein
LESPASQHPRSLKKKENRQVSELLNTAPGIEYVGSKACGQCHAGIYDEYIRTDMGRSMSLPSDSAQLEKVPAPIKVYDKRSGHYFEVYREGSSLYQSEYELDSQGAEIFRQTFRIEYVIGSGVNGFSYAIRRDNRLFEAPLSFYSKANGWGLSPGYEFGDYGFSRPILVGCVACHSGRPNPVAQREAEYQEPAFRELAIGCENCHGPGKLHVGERQQGLPVIGGVDRSIVNPSKLPTWLADNICMNCHQSGDARALQREKSELSFRPGKPLDETAAIFLVPFRRESPPADPLLQHYALMILSKCYRASGQRLGCITCHDPHRQLPSSEAPNYYRKKCLSCHTERSCTIPAQMRLRKTPPDDCAGCHMPKQNLKVISHSSLTDHRIVAAEGEPYPEVAFHLTTPALPDLIHLSAVPDHTDAHVPPLTLFQAYAALMGTYPQYQPRYHELLNQLSHDDPENLLVISALGHQKAAETDPEATRVAIQLLSRAVDHGSTAPEDFETLADLFARSGQFSQAIAILRRGVSVAPYNPRLYKALALLYISTQQYAEGLETMRRELWLFPQDSFMRMLVKKAEKAAGPP